MLCDLWRILGTMDQPVDVFEAIDLTRQHSAFSRFLVKDFKKLAQDSSCSFPDVYHI
jgi:hypothetical protein